MIPPRYALRLAATLVLAAAGAFPVAGCEGPAVDPPPPDAGAADGGTAPGLDGGEADGGSDAGSGLIPQVYVVTSLASNGTPAAPHVDASLMNGWGLSAGPTSALWLASRNDDVARSYDSTGAPASAPIAIASPAANGTSHPTGIAFNGEASFKGDTIVVVTDSGLIEGWQNGPSALIRVDNTTSEADYKGVAIARTSFGDRLYATNFHAGVVEMYDGDYTLLGTFTDAMIPADFSPFNVVVLDGGLYVTYALTDSYRQNDVHGAGNGYVDFFNTAGQLQTRLIATGALNSPYGVAHSPIDYGRFSDVLLVANVGDGLINTYDPVRGDLLGHLDLPGYAPVAVSRIHSMLFGNDQGAGPHNVLFFAAGPNDGADGILGSVAPTF